MRVPEYVVPQHHHRMAHMHIYWSHDSVSMHIYSFVHEKVFQLLLAPTSVFSQPRVDLGAYHGAKHPVIKNMRSAPATICQSLPQRGVPLPVQGIPIGQAAVDTWCPKKPQAPKLYQHVQARLTAAFRTSPPEVPGHVKRKRGCHAAMHTVAKSAGLLLQRRLEVHHCG